MENKNNLVRLKEKILSRRTKNTYPSVLVDNIETIKSLLESPEQFTPVEIYNAINKKGQRLSYEKFKQFIRKELGIVLMSDADKRRRRINFIIDSMKNDPEIYSAVQKAFTKSKKEDDYATKD